MDNEFDNEDNREIEELKDLIRKKMQQEIAIISQMVQNAPKDDEGNSVVEIIGIRNFGIFYNFCN